MLFLRIINRIKEYMTYLKYRIEEIDKTSLKEKFFESVKEKLKKLGWFVASVFVGIIVFGIITGMFNNSKFDVTFYQVKSDKIANPMRIVLLTDLHLAEFGDNNVVLVDEIKNLKPDMIAMVGDMTNDYRNNYSVLINLINSLKDECEAPIYYSYGNHEVNYVYNKNKQFEEDVKATGINLLKNSSVAADIAGNKICIGGLITEYKYYRSHYAPKFMEKFQKNESFKLLLVHYPEYFTEEFHNNLKVDLALCGHTHGGNIRIPGLGAVYAQVQGFFPELTEGANEYGKCTVVVSRGLGGRWMIPRINNHPEVVVVDVN